MMKCSALFLSMRQQPIFRPSFIPRFSIQWLKIAWCIRCTDWSVAQNTFSPWRQLVRPYPRRVRLGLNLNMGSPARAWPSKFGSCRANLSGWVWASFWGLDSCFLVFRDGNWSFIPALHVYIKNKIQPVLWANLGLEKRNAVRLQVRLVCSSGFTLFF